MTFYSDIASGTTVTDVTAGAGQTTTVEGTTIGAVLSHTGSRKGTIIVQSGGVESGTIVNAALDNVAAGGSAYGSILSGSIVGTTSVTAIQTVAGLASGTIMNAASVQLVNSGGTAIGTQAITGSQTISAGGTTSGTIVSFATVFDNGTEYNAIYNGGTEFVGSGGSAIGDILGQTGTSPGAIQNLANGASTTSTTVGNNARQIVSAGATATSTTVLSGGTIELVAAGSSADPGLHVSDGGKIVLDYIDFTSATADFNYVTDVLTITGQLYGGGTASTTLQLSGDYTGEYFNAVEVPGGQHIGTQISETTTPCYCPGTLIATDKGEVPVEALAIGDRVATVSGEMRPIKWIGKRSFAGRFLMGRTDILPVCIKAGALADNVPAHDLWISPHHAMYLDGVLIEAKDLVNGVTIVQASKAETVEYYHVELDSHDVLFAEGAPSETYVDDESRAMFHNAQEFAKLYPDEAFELARYYAPRIEDGEVLEAIRGRIGRRASLIEGHRAAA